MPRLRSSRRTYVRPFIAHTTYDRPRVPDGSAVTFDTKATRRACTFRPVKMTVFSRTIFQVAVDVLARISPIGGKIRDATADTSLTLRCCSLAAISDFT